MLALAPPFEGAGRIVRRLFEMEWMVAGVQPLGSRETKNLHRPATALAWASFRGDDLAMLARLRRARPHGERTSAVTVHLRAQQLEGVCRAILRIAPVGAVSLPRRNGQDVGPH